LQIYFIFARFCDATRDATFSFVGIAYHVSKSDVDKGKVASHEKIYISGVNIE
jgi:hypothetical protein